MIEVIGQLRELVKGEVFDSQILMYCLKAYKKPRDKITQLIKNEVIIQIKRGVYVFGPTFRKGLLSPEIIASMLVQPSYISREYALSKYGLFSERVESVTSMTTRKKKHFETKVGRFDFFSLSKEKFGVGVEVKEIPQEGGYLFASKEKALADWLASIPPVRNKEALKFFLFEESRIHESALFPLNIPLLEEISILYRNGNVNLLQTL